MISPRVRQALNIASLARWACLAVLSCGCGDEPAKQTKTNIGSSQLRIAAAADLKFAFTDLLTEFHRDHPEIDVQVTFGSSGNFYSQLTQQAPFDLYLSADQVYPQKLIAQGLADPDSQFTYGIGRIVLWVATDSPLDLETQGLSALLSEQVRKIAIANPQHAPYGRAAEAALQSTGIYDQVRNRLVLGENIAQAAQFIESGAADAGVIALSLALAPQMRAHGRYYQIPADVYPSMEQSGIILNWAQDKHSAEIFREFITGPAGQKILQQYGFGRPGTDN